MSTGSRRAGAAPRPRLRAPKRTGPDMSPHDMWRRLSRAVREIYNHNSSSLSYEENFRYAYIFVLHNHGDILYEGITHLLEEHLSLKCKDLIVPAFPPERTLCPLADAATDASAPNSTAAQSKDKVRNKGKGKEKGKARATSDDEVSAAAPRSDPVGPAAVEFDRADAITIAQAGERLLKAIRDVWDDHCACTSTLSKVLNYVDRVYVPQQNRLPSWDLGLELFRQHVVCSEQYPIRRNLYGTILTQIQLEREGTVVSRTAIQSCVDMLVTLNFPEPNVSFYHRPTLYKRQFEDLFLRATSDFYRVEAARAIGAPGAPFLAGDSDAGAYLRLVARRLKEEDERVSVYLHDSTGPELRWLLDKTFLEDHLEQILERPGSGLSVMLDENRTGDLVLLYQLFHRVELGIPALKDGLKRYILARGHSINTAIAPINSSDQPAEGAAVEAAPKSSAVQTLTIALNWVEQVVQFKAKFDKVLTQCLQSDVGCETAINEAFETLINRNPRAPEFISLFIDENLKKGLKGKTEKQVDEVLDQTILLFRYLDQKDAFETYYKTHLGRRLLSGKSASDDAERNMMAKLKVECGHNYVHKLSGMLNDMRLSEEASQRFMEETSSHPPNGPETMIDEHVTVLTATYWPSQISGTNKQHTVSWPPVLAQAKDRFEGWYHAQHNGRRLAWQPHLGMADVKVQFRARTHELNVSTYALVVLLQFEPGRRAAPTAPDSAEPSAAAGTLVEPTLDYLTLRERTGIPDGELRRTLQSLACAKYKILLKQPKGRDVLDTDRFQFNTNFTCPLAKIKIAQIVARVETPTEKKETDRRVLEERMHLTDAAIVRIMKNRKSATHSELITETVRMISTRFRPSLADIKKRIESLIDREYLERLPDNRNTYQYLA